MTVNSRSGSLLVCTVMADDGPVRHRVRVELKAQQEFILNAGPNGKPERSSIDSVVATTPPAIAAAVKEWTGISDRSKFITARFYHTPANSRFDVISYEPCRC